jgi:anti-sigma factor RsiW
VQSSDQHTVKPWFNGRVPFGVPVFDFAASGFPLVGGRLDYVGGREVAALVYGRRKHLINAFVWPEPADAAPTELAERGYAVLHFAGGGLAWWLVSDASPADLRELQGLLAEQR